MKILITKDLFDANYGEEQYTDKHDCPAARALRKAGFEVGEKAFSVSGNGDILGPGRGHWTYQTTPWNYKVSLEVKADLDSGKIEAYVIDYPTLNASDSHGEIKE